MKLTITDPAAFNASVAWVARHLSGRPTVAILAGIRIEATSEGVRLAIFNYDVAAICDPCPGVNVVEEGIAAVSAQLLTQLVGSVRPTSITTDERGLHLASGRSKARLPVMDPSTLPSLPPLPELTVEVVGSDLSAAVQRLAPMIADPVVWAAGAGIHMATTDRQLVMVASDKYRIARHTVDASGQLASGRTVPVPPLLAAVKGWTNEEAYLGCDDSGIVVQQQERITSIRCIAEPFPELGATIDKRCPERVSFDHAALLEAAKQVVPLAPALDLELTADKAIARASNNLTREAVADWQTVLTCEATEPATLRFNPKYLVDALNATAGDGERVEITYTAGSRPTHINPDGAATVVVMTMKRS